MSNLNTTSKKLNKQVGVRLPDLFKENEIDACAQKENQSSSQFLNDVLFKYFTSNLSKQILNILEKVSSTISNLPSREEIIDFINKDFVHSDELLSIYNNLETDVAKYNLILMLIKKYIEERTNIMHDPIYPERGEEITKYGIYLSDEVRVYLNKVSEITGLTKSSLVEKAFCKYYVTSKKTKYIPDEKNEKVK